MSSKVIICKDMDLIQLAQDRVQLQAVANTEMKFWIP